MRSYTYYAGAESLDVSIKEPELVKKFIDLLEEQIKSEIFHNQFKKAGELIAFHQDLEEGYKSMMEKREAKDYDTVRAE